ncbi:MAG: dephospho-CoA kinase [Bacteroidetes bacterium]|nr:MAG: dephospho-CoA kinase [Bacteroidota bacterium]
MKIGLTGNIGSGKSTVARVFNILGVPVYHSDERAKGFLHYKGVKGRLMSRFGPVIFEGTEIDRRKLAGIVFNDKESLGFLNSLIHPLVRRDFEEWCAEKNGEPYVVQEAAILFESGLYKLFDKTIVIACPEEIAVRRVMERDHVREEEVRARMKNQRGQEGKMKLADYIVVNDNAKMVIPQVLKIHKELILLIK